MRGMSEHSTPLFEMLMYGCPALNYVRRASCASVSSHMTAIPPKHIKTDALPHAGCYSSCSQRALRPSIWSDHGTTDQGQPYTVALQSMNDVRGATEPTTINGWASFSSVATLPQCNLGSCTLSSPTAHDHATRSDKATRTSSRPPSSWPHIHHANTSIRTPLEKEPLISKTRPTSASLDTWLAHRAPRQAHHIIMLPATARSIFLNAWGTLQLP